MTENFLQWIIYPDQSIKDAMHQMTKVHKGALAVVNSKMHLEGVISDGDIRRALLNESMMTSGVRQFLNTNPIVAFSKEEGFVLAEQHKVVLLPVVSKSYTLTGIIINQAGGYQYFEVSIGNANVDSNSILVVIPARGGSKRIPHKNLQKLAGQTLVARAVQVAKRAFPDAYILVSTDDPKIEAESKNIGAQVPWLRPPHLATDDASTFSVIEHALNWVTSNVTKNLKAIVLVEPTAPLRKPSHLTEAYNLFELNDADSVVSVNEINHVFNPEEQLTLLEDGKLSPLTLGKNMNNRLPRLKQKKTYVQNGIVYILRPDNILLHKNLYGNISRPYMVDSKYFADIDEPMDIILAEAKFKSGTL